MKKFILCFALLSLTLIVGCGPKDGGSPYVVSEEKAPVKVKLTKGGVAYKADDVQAPTVAMYGVGGFRVDLQPKGNGVFESTVPHGEYSVTLMATKGRTMLTQTVGRNVKVGSGPNDFTFQVK